MSETLKYNSLLSQKLKDVGTPSGCMQNCIRVQMRNVDKTAQVVLMVLLQTALVCAQYARGPMVAIVMQPFANRLPVQIDAPMS